MGKRKNSRKDSDKLAAFDPQNVAQEYHEQFADELKDYDYEIGIKNSGDFVAIVPEAACMNIYLRARKGDVTAAVDQYVKAEYFFKQQRCSTILEEDPNEHIYAATCPHWNHGFGKDGEPIYWERTGVIDTKRLLSVLCPKDLIRRHVRQQELALQRMRPGVEKQIIICDLKGLSMWPHNAAMKVFRETIRIDQAYYPERLKVLYMINAPWIFRPIWAMVRPWLDPVTKDKFHILGSGYVDTLLEHIDADQIPEEFGGTLKDKNIAELVPLTAAQEEAAMQRVKDIKNGTRKTEFEGLEFDGEGDNRDENGGTPDVKNIPDASATEESVQTEQPPAEEQGFMAKLTTWL